MSARRVAVNIGSGFVPGLGAVVAGATLAAHNVGWDIVGIRDGYDGLLRPEHYPAGGVETLTRGAVDTLAGGGSLIGTGARSDPFRVRTIGADNAVEEQDRSDDLLHALRAAGIDAVISIVGGSPITGLHALSVAFRLHRKGLPTICIPKSVENDIAGVPQPFGYASVLAHTIETLERIRAAAQDVGRVAVVEVPGRHAGWLALQAGMASLADVVLLPEVPYHLDAVAESLAAHDGASGRAALVVVAEGARSAEPEVAPAQADPLQASLAPHADAAFGSGEHVVDRSGATGQAVALRLQRLADRDVLPLALGHLVRGGAPTAADRQLGLAYGAGAIRALAAGENGVMLSFQAPEIRALPLATPLQSVRTVPPASELMQTARALGIAFGDRR